MSLAKTQLLEKPLSGMEISREENSAGCKMPPSSSPWIHRGKSAELRRGLGTDTNMDSGWHRSEGMRGSEVQCGEGGLNDILFEKA